MSSMCSRVVRRATLQAATVHVEWAGLDIKVSAHQAATGGASLAITAVRQE
eukprot:CAMPEP_0179147968 /NCGR_PEP_ID=MMETSP0796-20121207/71569_1 /TAXON_ID=73915 /ORGANISM="Pyrodinium bahamense, Strain pbaha01" /LENGTH=50 /DNA_ID=CAMNT_0020848627 /DNA_START=90 /DNA_END=238 /DNA_ORIENTATION=-